jgi:hypothetical protein
MPVAVVAPPPEPLSQAIPAGERTFFNKMVDWIIGDGPENSVSQICESCKKFNGTIPKEEATFNRKFTIPFLFLSFPSFHPLFFPFSFQCSSSCSFPSLVFLLSIFPFSLLLVLEFTCYYCKHSNGKGIPQVLTQPILPKRLPAPLQLASPSSSSSSSSSSSRKRLEEELPNLKTEEEEKEEQVPVETNEEEQAEVEEVKEVTQANDERKDTPVQEEEKETEEEEDESDKKKD